MPTIGGKRRRCRVALATCADLRDGDEDFPALVAALGALGVHAEPAVWDGDVDWGAFDLVVVRSTWDYAERRDDFLAWARSLPRVRNPVSTLEWSTDKQRYLPDLAAAGVPTVRSRFVEPGERFEPPVSPFVVKPAVSAGGRSSARFSAAEGAAAAALVERLHAEGRTALIQPYLGDVEEVALVYVDGMYSHALRRRVPLPAAGARSVLFLEEELAPATPSGRQRAIADAAIACAPDPLLYARVDLLGDEVLELEAAEPSLYLAFGDGATTRLAGAIRQALVGAGTAVP